MPDRSKMSRLAIASLLAGAITAPVANAMPLQGEYTSKAYAPKKIHIAGLCHEKIGKSTYTRVELTLGASDKTRRVAFQWVGGWRPIWKDGALVKTVPKRQRAHFRWIMRELNRFCNSG